MLSRRRYWLFSRPIRCWSRSRHDLPLRRVGCWHGVVGLFGFDSRAGCILSRLRAVRVTLGWLTCGVGRYVSLLLNAINPSSLSVQLCALEARPAALKPGHGSLEGSSSVDNDGSPSKCKRTATIRGRGHATSEAETVM